jgi:peptidoglycan/xylan/chitin deacetylase (PgdA/CDA1 family)
VIRTLPLSTSRFLPCMPHPVVFKILRFSGLPFLFRELVQRRRVTILLFHDLSPETAARTFDYLSSKYHFLDLRTFIRACQAANSGNSKSEAPNPKQIPITKKEENSKPDSRPAPALGSLEFRIWDLLRDSNFVLRISALRAAVLRIFAPRWGGLPPKSLVVTFDDGYLRNHELLPLIRARRIPVTIFLCAGIVGTKRHFWFKHKAALHRSFQLLKISDAGRRRLLRTAGFTRRKEYDEPHALTMPQIEEMKPWVDFQSHTLFHPCLPRCGLSQARVEIAQSRDVLRRQYGLEINALAYPHGNYSDRDIQLCEQAGYDCGLTVDPGFNTVKTNRYRLKRLPVNDTDDINELIVKASGLWELLKRLSGKNHEYGWTDEVEP